ncbi:hypothetical protein ACLB2K_066612 [Fragaria x ananassa]
MDGSSSGVEDNEMDWNTEDELELENFTLSHSSSLVLTGGKATAVSGEVLESSSQEQQQTDSDQFSSDYEGSFLDYFSELDSSSDERGHLHTDYAKKKRKLLVDEVSKRKRQKNRLIGEDNETVRLPKPMIGFGIPAGPCQSYRNLPKAAIGPPYFYYENVALTPKGVWDTISRFLFDVPPEFVDSKYFCAAARKRGYVHNLPIENRFPLVPLPPQTIHEALPLSTKWWPSWDTRTKLNCLVTCHSSAKLTERIMKALEGYDDIPPERIQRGVMNECRKWNLVWVGKNRVAPLEPDEFEMLLGFPKNHTRGISRTDRYKSLGNAFQIDTVAYHFSVLRDMFPNGMNVLSLFSGIGGAEIALHRLGIRMKNVVSLEISEVNRNVVSKRLLTSSLHLPITGLQSLQQLQTVFYCQKFNIFSRCCMNNLAKRVAAFVITNNSSSTSNDGVREKAAIDIQLPFPWAYRPPFKLDSRLWRLKKLL